MDKKVRVAIIGCGGIANGKHMPGLAKLESVEMVAFCDIVRSRAEEAAEKYGVADARVYEDYRELLEKENLDAVHVCTPNNSHAEISIAAMEAGCHVMCKSPWQDCRRGKGDGGRGQAHREETGYRLSEPLPP